MTNRFNAFDPKKIVDAIDWQLLLFLLLFMDVKIVAKALAILLLFIMRPGFRFGFAFKNTRLPLFYPFVMLLAVVNWGIYGGYSDLNYSIAVATGLFFWTMCILVIHQVKGFTERLNATVIYQTIIAFFILNAVVSLTSIGSIILKTGALNPYRFQGNFQEYFINTGDYIRGITFDTSTTNAALNVLGVILFLDKKNVPMLLLCMIVLLLCGSNFLNILLVLVFLYLFVFRSDAFQKSMMAVCILILVTFLVRISPQNNRYGTEIFGKLINGTDRTVKRPKKEPAITEIPDNALTPEQRKVKIATLYGDSISRSLERPAAGGAPPIVQKPEIPVPSIHGPTFQSRSDTTEAQRKLIGFIGAHRKRLVLAKTPVSVVQRPGKVIALNQLLHFFKQHPAKLITGNGMGNFSSKLAFRVAGIDLAGGYPARFRRTHPDFLSNHLDVYLDFFSKRIGKHSLVNSPNAVYYQLLGEYGIAGVMLFLVFYVGFFVVRYRHLTYGIPCVLVLLALFLTDYWFEQLSVVVFIELLLFLNVKENTKPVKIHA